LLLKLTPKNRQTLEEVHGQVTELQAEFDRAQEQHRHALADDQVEAGRKQVALNGTTRELGEANSALQQARRENKTAQNVAVANAVERFTHSR